MSDTPEKRATREAIVEIIRNRSQNRTTLAVTGFTDQAMQDWGDNHTIAMAIRELQGLVQVAQELQVELARRQERA